MTATPREKILELLSTGKISPQEADELLAALGAPKRRWLTWAFDPLRYLSPAQALLLGLPVALLGVVLSRLGANFDGPLDMHLARGGVPWRLAGVELLVDWPLAAAVFWGAAALFGRRGRPIDFLAAVGLGRIPIVLAGAVAVAFSPGVPSTPAQAEPRVVLFGLALLPLVAWSVAALVLGHRTASGLKGARLVVSFLLALLAAEVVAKLALWPLG